MSRDLRIGFVCPFCGGEHSVKVKIEDYLFWRDGELAQNAFPYLTATEREQVISNICPDCQKDLADVFGAEEDEGDDILACERDSLDSTGQWW